MADPRYGEVWLEGVLEQNLGRVRAPRELRARVEGRQSMPVRPRVVPFGWAAVAAMGIAAAIWSLSGPSTHGMGTDATLAIEALERTPHELDFRSERVSEIRTWVKARTGMDIPFPANPSTEVMFSGACGMKGGGVGVEVCCRVRGNKTALVVCKATHVEADGKHRFLRSESRGGLRVSTWTMRGQLYTLAYAAPAATSRDGREECLLCHAGGQQLTFSN